GAGTERLLAAVEHGVDRALETAQDSSAAVARLAGALDAVPWALVVCDEDGRLVARNLAADVLRAEPEMEALIERAIGSDLGAGTGTEKTFELVGPPRRTVRLRSSVIDDGRRVVGVLVVAEDRTDDLRLEQAEKELVAGAGERLRAPMSALASLAEMVAAELESAGTNRVEARTTQRLAERLKLESERAEQAVEELLAQARADARPANVDSTTLDELVTAAVDSVSGVARRRNVRVSVEHAGRSDAAVSGDRRQLVAAVAQLLDNAVKWSPSGQAVTVRTASDGHI